MSIFLSTLLSVFIQGVVPRPGNAESYHMLKRRKMKKDQSKIRTIQPLQLRDFTCIDTADQIASIQAWLEITDMVEQDCLTNVESMKAPPELLCEILTDKLINSTEVILTHFMQKNLTAAPSVTSNLSTTVT